MEQYIIKDKNILETQSYLSEVSSSFLYEKIYGVFPCEVWGEEYELGLMNFILKNNNFKLISHYNWKNQDFHYKFGNNSFFNVKVKENFTYWFINEVDELVIRTKYDSESIQVSVSSKNLEVIHKFISSIKKFINKKPKLEIGIIYNAGQQLDIKKIKIEPVELNLETNYGKEFVEKHKLIVKRLTDKKTGLYLFHSKPGNGKSFYIKYLTQNIPDRLFIFIPTSMIESIVSPNLISLLLQYPNSVLILEDAEKAILSREENPENASLVSTILNLTDGILSDLLHISVIVTFNVNKEKIDPAICRKGRLQMEHEFKELSIENGKRLAKSLGKDENLINKEMNLAEIYNLSDNNYHNDLDITKEKSIGFAAR